MYILKYYVFIGTYTSGTSKGIHTCTLDLETGILEHQFENDYIDQPSFLAISPNHRYLYAVNEVETFQGAPGGAVSASQGGGGGGGDCPDTVQRARAHRL